MRQPREIVSRTVRLPEVCGITLDNARLMLRNAGIEAASVRLRYEEAYRPEDEVIRQQPQSGSLVRVDEPIELVVSRRSLINHLPQVYQKADRTGGHFLREFLWVFDHIFADVHRHLDRVHTYFDPLESPPEFLAWLAGWVALAIDQDWPEAKQRKLIRQAIDMYGYRGTVRGLKLFLSIFTGVEPRLTENEWPYEGFRVGTTIIGVDSIILPPVDLAHCFMVEVPAEYTDTSDEQILKIHDIIRMEKPAHTAYYLTFAAAPERQELTGFVIGVHGVGTEDPDRMGRVGRASESYASPTAADPQGETE